MHLSSTQKKSPKKNPQKKDLFHDQNGSKLCQPRCRKPGRRQFLALLTRSCSATIVETGFALPGGALSGSATLILVVDDFAPWRHYISTTFQKQPRFRIIDEASDGVEAVEKARALKPDLILLDVGLPLLDGVEAARRIRKLSPSSKILFLSENRSPSVAEEALRAGAVGYVVKSDAARQLLPAVEAVLEGKQFVSSSLAAEYRNDREHSAVTTRGRIVEFTPPGGETATRHEVGFYYDDQDLLDDAAQFIGSALKEGNAAISVVTESHRESLYPRLQAYGVDIRAAVDQGRYIALDAATTLSTFMDKGMPDPTRFVKLFGQLILSTANAAKGAHPRVAVFGEGVGLLCAEGNTEAAIQVERLANQLVKTYAIDVLCAYSLGAEHRMNSHIFQRICAEHSAVHSR